MTSPRLDETKVWRDGPMPPPPGYKPMPVPPTNGLLATSVGSQQQPLPPIDPTKYENDDVVGEVNRITSQDNDFMKLARTAGLQTANKRGLLNSSIAAGASQASALQAAAPLATANAQIRGARNLERVQSHFAGERQGADIAARKGMLESQLANERLLQGRDIGARKEMLASQLSNEQLLQTRDIAARLKMQGLDLRNQRDMQSAQIAATRELTTMNIEAEMERLGRQLTAQEEMQIRDLSEAQARLAMQIASQEKISGDELENRLQIADLDNKTRTQLMAMENASQEKVSALNYYLAQDQIYAQGLVSLYNNENLPAPARQDALNQLVAMKNSGVNLPAALFGTNFSWPTSGGGTTTAPVTGTPTPGSGTSPTNGTGLAPRATFPVPGGLLSGGGSVGGVTGGTLGGGGGMYLANSPLPPSGSAGSFGSITTYGGGTPNSYYSSPTTQSATPTGNFTASQQQAIDAYVANGGAQEVAEELAKAGVL